MNNVIKKIIQFFQNLASVLSCTTKELIKKPIKELAQISLQYAYILVSLLKHFIILLFY